MEHVEAAAHKDFFVHHFLQLPFIEFFSQPGLYLIVPESVGGFSDEKPVH
jgi:hypothetical protein